MELIFSYETLTGNKRSNMFVVLSANGLMFRNRTARDKDRFVKQPCSKIILKTLKFQ